MILNLMKFWRHVHHLMVCLVLTMNLYVDFSRIFLKKIQFYIQQLNLMYYSILWCILRKTGCLSKSMESLIEQNVGLSVSAWFLFHQTYTSIDLFIQNE